MDIIYLNAFLPINEYKFQDLCRDLLGKQKEDGIATCRRYEEQGVKQRSVDVLANCTDRRSIDVGQCKRYKTFYPNKSVMPLTSFSSIFNAGKI